MVVEDSDPEDGKKPREHADIGVIGFDFSAFDDGNASVNNNNYNYPYLQLFLKLWPGMSDDKVKVQVQKANTEIKKHNSDKPKTKQIKLTTEKEHLKFIGVVIGASPQGKGGASLWEKAGSRQDRTFALPADLGPTESGGLGFFPECRFEQLRKFFPHAFHNNETKDDSNP